EQERDFRFSTHKRCQPSCLSHIETPPGSTFLEDVVHVDGFSNTSERLRSQVLTLEVALDQAIGRFTDRNRIGSCQSLNSRRHIGCLAQGKLLVPCTASHSPDYD